MVKILRTVFTTTTVLFTSTLVGRSLQAVPSSDVLGSIKVADGLRKSIMASPKPYMSLLDPIVMLTQSREALRITPNAVAESTDASSSAAVPKSELISMLKTATYAAEALVDAFTLYESSSQLPFNAFTDKSAPVPKVDNPTLGSLGYGGAAVMAQQLLAAFRHDPSLFSPITIGGQVVTTDSLVPTNDVVSTLLQQAEQLSSELDRLLILTSSGKESAINRVAEDLQAILTELTKNPNNPYLLAALIKQISLVAVTLDRMQDQWVFVDPISALTAQEIQKQSQIVSYQALTDAVFDVNVTSILTNATNLLVDLLSLNGSLIAPIIEMESDFAQGLLNLTETLVTLTLNNDITKDLQALLLSPVQEIRYLFTDLTNISLFNLSSIDPIGTLSELIEFGVSLLDINNIISFVSNVTTSVPYFLTNVVNTTSNLTSALVNDVLSLLTAEGIESLLSNLTTVVTQFATTALSAIPDLSTLVTNITSVFTGLTNTALSTLTGLSNSLLNSVTSGLSSVTNTLSSVTTGLTPSTNAYTSAVPAVINTSATRGAAEVNQAKAQADAVSSPVAKLSDAFVDLNSAVGVQIASALATLTSVLITPQTEIMQTIQEYAQPELVESGVQAASEVFKEISHAVYDVVPDLKTVETINTEISSLAANLSGKASEAIDATANGLLTALTAATEVAMTPAQTTALLSNILKMRPLSDLLRPSSKRKLQSTSKNIKGSEVPVAQAQMNYLTEKLPVLESEIKLYGNLKTTECTQLYNHVRENIIQGKAAGMAQVKLQIDKVCTSSGLDALNEQFANLKQVYALLRVSPQESKIASHHAQLQGVVEAFSKALIAEKSLALERTSLLKSLGLLK